MMSAPSTRLQILGQCAIMALALCLPWSAHAIVNGADTPLYSAIGEVSGASGILISDNWALTAAHVAAGIVPDVTTFEGLTGSTPIDAVYFFADVDFPNHDIALLHLSTAIAASLPVLNDVMVSASEAAQLGELTIVSAQNATPNGSGVTYGQSALTTYEGLNGTATVNWLVTQGGSSVEGGDSGGALFLGTPSDSQGAVLMGVVSAAAYEIVGNQAPDESTFVQVAAYKSWIDNTMAASGQSATWSSTPVSVSSAVVPEPSTAAMFALCGLAAVAHGRTRRRCLAR
jgi:hypothetical protein